MIWSFLKKKSPAKEISSKIKLEVNSNLIFGYDRILDNFERKLGHFDLITSSPLMGGPVVILSGRLGDIDKRRDLVYNRYVYLEGVTR